MLHRWHNIPVEHFLGIFAELRVLHVPDMHTSFQIADASFCGVHDLSDPANNICQCFGSLQCIPQLTCR